MTVAMIVTGMVLMFMTMVLRVVVIFVAFLLRVVMRVVVVAVMVFLVLVIMAVIVFFVLVLMRLVIVLMLLVIMVLMAVARMVVVVLLVRMLLFLGIMVCHATLSVVGVLMVGVAVIGGASFVTVVMRVWIRVRLGQQVALEALEFGPQLRNVPPEKDLLCRWQRSQRLFDGFRNRLDHDLLYELQYDCCWQGCGGKKIAGKQHEETCEDPHHGWLVACCQQVEQGRCVRPLVPSPYSTVCKVSFPIIFWCVNHEWPYAYCVGSTHL